MPAACSTISLSVSDVVVINRGGKEEAHYCDSIGFTPVPEFMQESQMLCLSRCFYICAESFKAGTIFDIRHIAPPTYIVYFILAQWNGAICT